LRWSTLFVVRQDLPNEKWPSHMWDLP
jgi:hypothetical protein